MLRVFLSCGCLTLLLSGLAGADVRYTLASKTPNSPVVSKTTTYVKGKRQRTETVTDMGANKLTQVSLIMCDTHQMAQVDPELKIYTLTPMGGAGGDSNGPVGKGTVTSTYAVKDLGSETVGKIKAHHWSVSTDTVTTGCAGNANTKTKAEVWVAPIQVLNCPEASYSQPNCQITRVEKGDVKGFRSVYTGMIVKTINFMGEQKTSEQEMEDYSTDSLPDSLFSFGPDYKKVTAAEFQQQEQQKMMKMYQKH